MPCHIVCLGIYKDIVVLAACIHHVFIMTILCTWLPVPAALHVLQKFSVDTETSLFKNFSCSIFCFYSFPSPNSSWILPHLPNPISGKLTWVLLSFFSKQKPRTKNNNNNKKTKRRRKKEGREERKNWKVKISQTKPEVVGDPKELSSRYNSSDAHMSSEVVGDPKEPSSRHNRTDVHMNSDTV